MPYCHWHYPFLKKLFSTVSGVDCGLDIDECAAMPCLNNGEIKVCILSIRTHYMCTYLRKTNGELRADLNLEVL